MSVVSWGVFPPQRVDDYEVIQPLASGGMGRVFLGHDRLLDRAVALKFIAPTNNDPRARERFVAEARALARIEHPNVVNVYRISHVDDQPYIAYEFVDGTALSRLPRPVPWRQVLSIAVGIARGLAAVHERGLLHRDVKPSNIVVGKNQVVKLIDFGLAEPNFDWGEPSREWVRERLRTEPGDRPESAEGTPVYMAPELSGGAPTTARSDLYALGVVLWEVLAGDLPGTNLAAEEMAARLLIDGLSPIGQVRRDLPAPLATLINQCTARNPDHRPRSAAVLRDRLETLRAIYAPLMTSPDDDPRAESNAARRLIASFERVAADRTFASRVYQRLFDQEPELRDRFPTLTAMHAKLVAALNTVVRGAGAPEVIVPLLEDLGRRHQEYGVSSAHLEMMSRALLATIAELDATTWTPALAHLWERTLRRVTDHVRRGMVRAAAEASGVFVLGGPSARDGTPPAPRYARAAGALIAYQCVGEGPRELVVVPSWVSHLELSWQEPGYARLMSKFGRRSRVTLYDRRGTGLSERDVTGIDLGRQVGDLLAVLDAAAIERAVLVALDEGAAVALLFAAMHPERVRALVLWGPTMAAPPSVASVDAWCDELQSRWGEAVFIEAMAPSRADDEAFRCWWARLLRSGTTASAAAALVRADAAVDLHCILPAISVPTLLVRRAGDQVAGGAAIAELADGFGGATCVELVGADHLMWASDPDRVATEIEAFFTELPTSVDNPVHLVTIMAVRSSEPAVTRRLHAAVETERGIMVEDGRGTVAVFRAPTAAVRALRAARPGVKIRAAILAEVVPFQGVDAEAVMIDAAWTLIATTPPGQLCLSPVARDLLGEAAVSGLDTGLDTPAPAR